MARRYIPLKRLAAINCFEEAYSILKKAITLFVIMAGWVLAFGYVAGRFANSKFEVNSPLTNQSRTYKRLSGPEALESALDPFLAVFTSHQHFVRVRICSERDRPGYFLLKSLPRHWLAYWCALLLAHYQHRGQSMHGDRAHIAKITQRLVIGWKGCGSYLRNLER